MRKIRTIAAIAATLVALLTLSLSPAKAQMTPSGDEFADLGTTPLATAMKLDTPAFDSNWADHDILVHLINRVLAAKPDSPLKVLKDGTIPVTVLAPDDLAFRALAGYRNGRGVVLSTEARVYAFIARLHIDTLERVLKYHLVPYEVIGAMDLLSSNGLSLPTEEGSPIRISIATTVKLVDASTQRRESLIRLSFIDINKGNRQVAHSISGVLLPSF
jgi:uncharacterized surface protein with fasciclin (FAS1) repeats